VGSTHTFTLDGAVPENGDLLIQVALLLDVQLRVPPPLLVMDREPLVRHTRVPPPRG
jgi:hypothetical protein